MGHEEQELMRLAQALNSPVFQDDKLLASVQKAETALLGLTAAMQAMEEETMVETEDGQKVHLSDWIEQTVASPEVEQELYASGIEALMQEQHELALDAFSSLVAIKSLDTRYLFGFALSLQHLNAVEKAAEYFSLAYALEPSNGACAYRIGECLLALGHHEEACDALRAAIELDAVPGADPEVREMAQELLDQII